MTYRYPVALILLGTLFFYANLAFCAQTYNPGFRTLGIWNEEAGERLDLAVWYPCGRQPKELNYPPWTITGAPNAKPAEGEFPLIALSHATPADRFSYHDLAAQLASEGFVVVAPTHLRDNMNDMSDLFSWGQIEKRAGEIRLALNRILSEPALGASVSKKKIGVIAFGAGATASLLLGGALPNCRLWSDYCARAGEGDPYCSSWAKERISDLCQELPLKKSMADTRIKAIAAVAPGFGMIFDSKSFAYFYPALLLVSAGREKLNRTEFHAGQIARFLGSKARYLDLPGVDADALIAPCPPGLERELPELCFSVSREQKNLNRAKLSGVLKAFFAYYLRKDENTPVIPDPPNLMPEPRESGNAAPVRQKTRVK